MKIRQLDERARKSAEDLEVRSFIARQKQVSYNSYQADPNGRIRLNKLCCIEDWENLEVKEIIPKLQDIDITINAKAYLQENRGRSTEKIGSGRLG